MSKTLLVFTGLSRQADENEIRALFDGLGDVVEIKQMKEMGIARVTLRTEEQATEAMAKVQGARIHGETFSVFQQDVPEPPPKSARPTIQNELTEFLNRGPSTTWAIDPLKGVGPLRFGSSLTDVRAALGPLPEPETWDGVTAVIRHEYNQFPSLDGWRVIRVRERPAEIGRRRRAFEKIKPHLKLTMFENPAAPLDRSLDRAGLELVFDEGDRLQGVRFIQSAITPTLDGLAFVGMGKREVDALELDSRVPYTVSQIAADSAAGLAYDRDVALSLKTEDLDERVYFVAWVFSPKFFDDVFASDVPPPTRVPSEALPDEDYGKVLRASGIERHFRLATLIAWKKSVDYAKGSRRFGFYRGNGKPKMCNACETEFSLAMQLHGRDMVGVCAAGTPEGALQLSTCLNPACDEASSVFRLEFVPQATLDAAPVTGGRFEEAIFKPIVDRLEFDDLTNAQMDLIVEALRRHGYADENAIWRFRENYERDRPSYKNSQIGGYPVWIQDAGCDPCPKCRSEKHMRFVVQVKPDEDNELYFGSMGLGYIHQCEKHPDVFVWETQFT